MKDRLPPHSPDSEAGLLGCCLTDPSRCIPECLTRLSASGEQMYGLRHQAIFSAMAEMVTSGQAVDLITLQQFLIDRQTLEQVGGIVYLSSLPDLIPSTANLSRYLDIVCEKWILRRLIHTCTEAVARVYDYEGDVDELVDELERDILAIQPARKSEAPTVKGLVRQALDAIEKLWESKGAIEGISTGLMDLDKKTGGLKPGEVTVIAAYPGGGKTSLAMNIAENAMLEQKRKVGVFSLEMSAVQLVTRFLCSHARVNLRNVASGFLSERDFPWITSSAGRISTAAVYFDDESDLSIQTLRAKARRMHQQHGIELLIIDYLQLLSASGGARKVESRQQEVADISRGVKAIARELSIPVIALSQLNDDGKLRESRAIGQDADNVWVLKEDEGSEEETERSGVELKIVKARNGPRGTVRLSFLRCYTRFENTAKISQQDTPDYSTPHND